MSNETKDIPRPTGKRYDSVDDLVQATCSPEVIAEYRRMKTRIEPKFWMIIFSGTWFFLTMTVSVAAFQWIQDSALNIYHRWTAFHVVSCTIILVYCVVTMTIFLWMASAKSSTKLPEALGREIDE